MKRVIVHSYVKLPDGKSAGEFMFFFFWKKLNVMLPIYRLYVLSNTGFFVPVDPRTLAHRADCQDEVEKEEEEEDGMSETATECGKL